MLPETMRFVSCINFGRSIVQSFICVVFQHAKDKIHHVDALLNYYFLF